MYKQQDTQFAGKHDFDKEAALSMALIANKTFSINIFQWQLNSTGKLIKRGKCIVRLRASVFKQHMAILMAENIVDDLDKGIWDGRKTVSLKD